MKQLRLVVALSMVLCSVLFLGVSTASAEDLSNTGITMAQFLAGACGGFITSLVSPFAFNNGVDGTVESQVWGGCGNGSAPFVYTYLITHNANSSEQMIHGISMQWQNLIAYDFPPPPAETSFWIIGTGPKEPSVAMINPSSAGGTLTFNFIHELNDHILRGENSTWFGAVSPLPPGTVFANLLNSGQEDEAMVLVPIPEPASLLLLSSGLMGLAGFKAGRRRKAKAIAVA